MTSEADDILLSELGCAGLCDVRLPGDTSSWGKEHSFRARAEGVMLVAGESARLGVGLLEGSPVSLPKIFVLDPAHRRLPHVAQDGYICAFEEENLVLDYRLPRELLAAAILRAKRVIEDGLLGRNRADLYEEAEAYWPGGRRVACVVDANNDVRLIEALQVGDSLAAVADDRKSLPRGEPGLAKARSFPAAYVPVLPSLLVAGLHPADLASPHALHTLLPHLPEKSRAFLEQTRVRRDQSYVVVLGLPRAGGGRSLLGLRLEKFPGDGNLLSEPHHVRPLRLERFDAERRAERQLESNASGRIVVIGCGAVGGYIADILARSATGEMVLVDPDHFHAGNASRHILGREAIVWPLPSKVSQMRKLLERQSTDLRVKDLCSRIEEVMRTQLDLVREASLIVVAIGNPTVPLWLNDTLTQGPSAPPVVHTWLEPYGLGGHAVLVGRRGGCLRCLFPDQGGGLTNKLDFAAPGQRFARRELGCHGLFTPYSDLDARQTALGAARLAQVALSDRDAHSVVHSWRGRADSFRAAGHRTSPRYDEPLPTDALLVASPGCGSCSGRRDQADLLPARRARSSQAQPGCALHDARLPAIALEGHRGGWCAARSPPA